MGLRIQEHSIASTLLMAPVKEHIGFMKLRFGIKHGHKQLDERAHTLETRTIDVLYNCSKTGWLRSKKVTPKIHQTALFRGTLMPVVTDSCAGRTLLELGGC